MTGFDPFFGRDPFKAFFDRPKEQGAWEFLLTQAILPLTEHAKFFYEYYETHTFDSEHRPQLIAYLDHRGDNTFVPHQGEGNFSHYHVDDLDRLMESLKRNPHPKKCDAVMFVYDSWAWPEEIVSRMQMRFDTMIKERPFDAGSVAIEIQKEHPSPKEYDDRREMATILGCSKQGDFFYATGLRGQKLVFHDTVQPRSVLAAMPSGIADTLRVLVGKER